MTGIANRTEERKSSFKSGLKASDGRRRREDTRVQLRKNKREEGLMKRRAMGSIKVGASVDASSVMTSAVSSTDPSSANSSSSGRIYTVTDIPQLLNGISTVTSMDDHVVMESIRGFRRMLSVEREPPCREVIVSGALPFFVKLLQQTENTDIQFEAAWALTNIASSDDTSAVVDCGAVPYLINMLRSGCPNVREQCAWCLGNIAGDSPELRDIVLMHGALEGILLNIAQPANNSLLGNVVWTLSNLCRGKPQPQLHIVSSALPHLASLLHNPKTPKGILIDVCWAFSYLSDGDDQRISACQDNNVTNRLVELLGSENDASLVTPALRTLGNFVSGSDAQTQAVIEAGVLHKGGALLSHPRKNIRKETCWLLSNIAAGTPHQIDSLLGRTDVVAAVVSALNADQWEVRKEAAWVVSNICTGGSVHHIEALVEMNSIEALCHILDVADSKIITVALEAIEAILRTGESLNKLTGYVSFIDEADGIDRIENLQEHENEEIYEKSIQLIEKYFGCDDAQEDENLVPVVSGDTFSFGLTAPKPIEGEESTEQPKLAPFNFDQEGGMQFNFA